MINQLNNYNLINCKGLKGRTMKKNKIKTKKQEKEVKEVLLEGCNHNPNDKQSSLKAFPKRNQVYPEEFFFICPCCHKGFSFLKDDNGKFVLKEQT